MLIPHRLVDPAQLLDRDLARVALVVHAVEEVTGELDVDPGSPEQRVELPLQGIELRLGDGGFVHDALPVLCGGPVYLHTRARTRRLALHGVAEQFLERLRHTTRTHRGVGDQLGPQLVHVRGGVAGRCDVELARHLAHALTIRPGKRRGAHERVICAARLGPGDIGCEDVDERLLRVEVELLALHALRPLLLEALVSVQREHIHQRRVAVTCCLEPLREPTPSRFQRVPQRMLQREHADRIRACDRVGRVGELLDIDVRVLLLRAPKVQLEHVE